MKNYNLLITNTLNKILQPDYVPTFNEDLIKLLKTNKEFYSYIYDKPNGSGKYYHLLHELVKDQSIKTIVELGNREGLGVLSIYSGMNSNQEFYSFDIINDLRFVPDFVKNDKKFNFILEDCCNKQIVEDLFANKKIDILFSDTVHVYDQIKKEWDLYKNYLADEAIILIDDINLGDKRKIINDIKHKKFNISENLHSSGYGVWLYKNKSKN